MGIPCDGVNTSHGRHIGGTAQIAPTAIIKSMWSGLVGCTFTVVSQVGSLSNRKAYLFYVENLSSQLEGSLKNFFSLR